MVPGPSGPGADTTLSAHVRLGLVLARARLEPALPHRPSPRARASSGVPGSGGTTSRSAREPTRGPVRLVHLGSCKPHPRCGRAGTFWLTQPSATTPRTTISVRGHQVNTDRDRRPAPHEVATGRAVVGGVLVGILVASLLLGFPYADVSGWVVALVPAAMGGGVIAFGVWRSRRPRSSQSWGIWIGFTCTGSCLVKECPHAVTNGETGAVGDQDRRISSLFVIGRYQANGATKGRSRMVRVGGADRRAPTKGHRCESFEMIRP